MQGRQLSDEIQFRCSAGLKQTIRVAAAKEGLQMSAYIRQVLREDADDAGTEDQK